MDNNRNGMLGANPEEINPEGMNELMDGMSYEQPEEEPVQPQGYQYQQPAQQQPAQQQQMMPPPAPTQYQNPEMGSIIPHYAKGGQTKEKRQMKNMPDLSLIDERPGYEDEQEEMPAMIVAHVSGEELKELDKMQGGRRIDPETGLPIYDGLVPFIGTPEMMAVFKDMVYEVAETGELSEEKARFAAELDPIFPLTEGLPVDAPPSEHEDFPLPGEKELAQKGIDGDHELAIIPRALADMLDEIRGETITNPNTGLPQYGLFKNMFKSIGKVAKFVGIGAAGLAAVTLGGPIGLGALALGAKTYGDYKTNKRYADDLKKSQEEYERKQREEIGKQETYHKGLVQNYIDRTDNFSNRLFKPTEDIDNILSDQQGAA